MEQFFFTLTASQVEYHVSAGNLHKNVKGTGCVCIFANNMEDARRKMTGVYGTKWSLPYSSIEDVHELDRRILASLR